MVSPGLSQASLASGTGSSPAMQLADEGPPAKTGKTGGRRPKRRNPKSKTDIKVADPGLHKLLEHLVRQTLINTRTICEVRAAVYETFTLSIESPVVKAMKEAGAAYAAAVAAEGPKHGRGPPALSVAAAMVSALHKEDIGGQNRNAMSEFLKLMGTFTLQQAAAHFRTCRLEKCFDDKLIKIVTIMGPEIRTLVGASFEQLGARRTIGAAPAGWLEEELDGFLDNLTV
eukprot:CAMPEP_0168497632 /NCGR_PEP_ID=MMETSP0228-20121227/72862_1 /TAXON_ID=133427 /ORGANISM="Protoceratium reticulatum, Strain CCCM 535 (=CCMP 1889)" /LENGTH=228 /DNA_ID=CAMNT_0008514507 /DNA_START=1 /DNA_END=687 /DNA_ORIENTATION=+